MITDKEIVKKFYSGFNIKYIADEIYNELKIKYMFNKDKLIKAEEESLNIVETAIYNDMTKNNKQG